MRIMVVTFMTLAFCVGWLAALVQCDAQTKIGDRISPMSTDDVKQLGEAIGRIVDEPEHWTKLDSKLLVDDLILLSGANGPDAVLLTSTLCSKIVGSKDLLIRINLEDRVRLLQVQGQIPVYWHQSGLDHLRLSDHVKHHIDSVLSTSQDLVDARSKLPKESPPLVRRNVGPLDDKERRLIEESRRNFAVSREIRVVEELQDSFSLHAPEVLARCLLFDSNPQDTLERIRTGPGITSDVYASTVREFSNLTMLRKL